MMTIRIDFDNANFELRSKFLVNFVAKKFLETTEDPKNLPTVAYRRGNFLI